MCVCVEGTEGVLEVSKEVGESGGVVRLGKWRGGSDEGEEMVSRGVWCAFGFVVSIRVGVRINTD